MQPLQKTIFRVLRQLKIDLPDGLPAILLLGVYPKEGKFTYEKANCTSIFVTAQSTAVKTWKQPLIAIERGLDKETVIHLLYGIQLGH